LITKKIRIWAIPTSQQSSMKCIRHLTLTTSLKRLLLIFIIKGIERQVTQISGSGLLGLDSALTRRSGERLHLPTSKKTLNFTAERVKNS
jgi:hypothetical protein